MWESYKSSYEDAANNVVLNRFKQNRPRFRCDVNSE